MYKNMKECKESEENSSPLYQTYTPTAFKNLNLKVDPHRGVEWSIHATKHRQENQLLSVNM